MKIGASTIPYRDVPLTRDILAAFKDAGIESLELCDYHPNFSYVDADFRAFLQKTLRDMSFHLNSIHIHLKTRDPACDLATLNSTECQQTLTAHKQAVDLAAALGGCILVTHDISIPEPDAEQGLEKRAAFLENLKEVADYAAPHDVRLALENVGRGYTRQPARLVGLLRDLDAANVGAVIDTGHRNLGGDPAAALRTMDRHLISLHLHDNHGEQDEHLLPGQGNIAWDQVGQALDDIPYGGVFMYEVNRVEDVPKLRDNAAWIRQL